MRIYTTENTDHPDRDRPLCPSCGVPMWLVEIERRGGPPHKDRLHFECKVCKTQAVVPPLE
jgi:hypothetical protein